MVIERPQSGRYWGSGEEYALVRAVVVRLVGLVYGLAFVSLWVQIDGLIGQGGILPVADYLPAVHERLGVEAYWRLPTLCWLSAADGMLYLLCAGGILAAVAAMVGVAPAPMLSLAWLFYLSLVGVGQAFLSFQWDILLLETGFLAIFLLLWHGNPAKSGRVRLPCWCCGCCAGCSSA